MREEKLGVGRIREGEEVNVIFIDEDKYAREALRRQEEAEARGYGLGYESARRYYRWTHEAFWWLVLSAAIFAAAYFAVKG